MIMNREKVPRKRTFSPQKLTFFALFQHFLVTKQHFLLNSLFHWPPGPSVPGPSVPGPSLPAFLFPVPYSLFPVSPIDAPNTSAHTKSGLFASAPEVVPRTEVSQYVQLSSSSASGQRRPAH